MSFLYRFLAFVLCLVPFGPLYAQTNYTTSVTVSSLKAGGVAVANAKICAVPADRYGNAISVSAPTWGLVLPSPALCGIVSNGAITGGIPVPDACHTNAAGPITYNFSVQLLTSGGIPSGSPVVFPAVPNVCGSTFALDTYTPAISVAAPLSNVLGYGSGVPASCTAPSIWIADDNAAAYTCHNGVYVTLAGAPGPPATFKGAYVPGQTYLIGDAVSYTDGSSYVSLVANNTSVPSAQSSQWAVLAGKGAPGANGVASLPQLANIQALASSTAGYGPNLIVKATLKPNFAVANTGGVPAYAATSSDYTAAPPIFIGGAPFTTTCQFNAHDGYNVYFLDGNLNELTGERITSGGIPVGTYTPSNDAAYVWGYVNVVHTGNAGDASTPCNTGTWQLVHGSTLPASYSSGDVYPASVVDSKITALSYATLSNAQADTRLPLYQNLLDPARLTANTAIHYDGTGANPTLTSANGFQLAGLIGVHGRPYVCSNKALHTGGQYGPEFLDSSGNPVAMSSDLLAYWSASAGIPANTCISVPSGADFYRPYLNDTSGGSGNQGPQGVACWMIVTSQTSTGTFPSTCQPFIGGASTVDPVARAAALPMAGQNVGWLGDSISYGLGSNLPLSPLVNAITGANDAFSLSWSGRKMYDALDNLGNTGTAFPTSTIVAGLKYLVLWLGTNVDTVGSSSDAASVGTSNANGITFPSSDSYASQLKGVLNQLLAWNPSLRIIKLSPYQSANQNTNAGCTPYPAVPCPAGLAILSSVHDVDVAIGKLYSIPVVDMYSNVGIGPQNFATALVDDVHPTATTQTNIIAPFIARQLMNYAVK